MDKQWLNSMMVYCSRSEHCVLDVLDKLYAAGLSEEEADEIVQCLVEQGYIDEQRYANAFVNDRFRFNKWGKLKIGHALRQKKIPTAIIQVALDTLDEDAYSHVLLQLIESKKKTVKGTATQQKAAVMRFAVSRGFEFDLVLRLLR
jgi:regulatory protein